MTAVTFLNNSLGLFGFNFNNKLCALLSYSATRHGIVEKSSRNIKAEYSMLACKSRGWHSSDFGRPVDPISTRGDRLCPPHYCMAP